MSWIVQAASKPAARSFLRVWLALLTVCLTLSPSWVSAVSSVTLAWDGSIDPGIAGYKIYYGTTSHSYSSSVDVGNVTSATISLPSDNATYYFAATTYDASGTESDFSNEATYTVVPGVTNQLPTLAPIHNVLVAMNASSQTVNLSGIGAGSGTGVVVTAVSSNPNLIPHPTVNYVNPNTTGTLGLAPATNATGSAIITVTVNNGQAQNNLVSQTFLAFVQPVYVAPTLDAISDVAVAKSSGLQVVNLSGITAGSGTNLAVTAISDNPSLVPNPTLAYSSPNSTGTLSFTPTAGKSGTATITVTVNNGTQFNNQAARAFAVKVGLRSASVASPALTTTPAAILTLVTNDNGGFAFNVTGIAGYQYVVQASQDLANWTPVQTNTSPFVFTDVNSGQFRQRFYRTLWVQNSLGAVASVTAASGAILTALPRLNGAFTFKVEGESGASYAIEISPDLIHWTALATNAAPFIYTDPTSIPARQRFYRTENVQ